ncbi:hypothetical protein FEM03_00120 [Phragmitibacter flavus]|uniref:Carboxymuconolactone decarboxylase family protein n=1 Tax=Phragmitibacter flavus TaxID=2576071 RepID=A0A5R8KJT8_9BACT|nr:hypothetical protein [Phragmitibacter flavus]TLD72520.1 hypothetical protein FEM03_00120 [Phragmitibacter flavus]
MPTEALFIAKIAAMRAQDCGPCTELNMKMALEAGVSDEVTQGALRGVKGLDAEQRDIHDYARGVAGIEELDPELLPRLCRGVGDVKSSQNSAVNIVSMGWQRHRRA